MKTFIEYLGSRLEPVDCAYIVEDMKEVPLKYKNLEIQLAKAGMRTVPLTDRCLRLKNGSRITFYSSGMALTGCAFDFVIVDGFIDHTWYDVMVKMRMKPKAGDNVIFMGGGMSQIRDFAKKQAYKRFY